MIITQILSERVDRALAQPASPKTMPAHPFSKPFAPIRIRLHGLDVTVSIRIATEDDSAPDAPPVERPATIAEALAALVAAGDAARILSA